MIAAHPSFIKLIYSVGPDGVSARRGLYKIESYIFLKLWAIIKVRGPIAVYTLALTPAAALILFVSSILPL